MMEAVNKKLAIGIDEVGLGCLAGSMCIGCVIMPKGFEGSYIYDSKKQTKQQLRVATLKIQKEAIFAKVYFVSVGLINKLGLWNAWDRMVAEIIFQVRSMYGYNLSVYVDGTRKIESYKTESIKKGDNKVINIAAASIIAKHVRDTYMVNIAREYKGYGFEKHVGYGTAYHIDKLKELGLSKIHREQSAKTALHNALRKELKK